MTVVSVLACEIFEYGYRKLLKKTNTCGDLSAPSPACCWPSSAL
jgi:electron transport complex protein RnfD